MKSILAKAGGALAFLLLCALLFDVPSAYAVAAGKPRWLAWGVGALALVVPLAWNIVGERKRVAPAKPSTTRGERIWLRTGFIALLVIGGLFAMARGKAWNAVRHHALWFVPYTAGPLEPTSGLLARVPSGAKAIIWLRDTSEARATLGQYTPVGEGDFEIVAAFDEEHHAIVMERGDVGLVDKIARLAQFAGSYARVGFNAPYSLPDGTRVWATPGWGISSSPPTALIDRLRGADDDAFLVGVVDSPKEHASGIAWLGGHDDELVAHVDVTAPSESVATKALDDVRRELAAKSKQLACWDTSGGVSSLDRDGARVRADARINASQLTTLFLCLDVKK